MSDTAKFNGEYSHHIFGAEKTVEEIVRRICWETEAEGIARNAGDNAIADGHALAKAAYVAKLKPKVYDIRYWKGNAGYTSVVYNVVDDNNNLHSRLTSLSRFYESVDGNRTFVFDKDFNFNMAIQLLADDGFLYVKSLPSY